MNVEMPLFTIDPDDCLDSKKVNTEFLTAVRAYFKLNVLDSAICAAAHVHDEAGDTQLGWGLRSDGALHLRLHLAQGMLNELSRHPFAGNPLYPEPRHRFWAHAVIWLLIRLPLEVRCSYAPRCEGVTSALDRPTEGGQ